MLAMDNLVFEYDGLAVHTAPHATMNSWYDGGEKYFLHQAAWCCLPVRWTIN